MLRVDSKRHTQEEGWCWLEGAEVVAQAVVTQALCTQMDSVMDNKEFIPWLLPNLESQIMLPPFVSLTAQL